MNLKKYLQKNEDERQMYYLIKTLIPLAIAKKQKITLLQARSELHSLLNVYKTFGINTIEALEELSKRKYFNLKDIKEN